MNLFQIVTILFLSNLFKTFTLKGKMYSTHFEQQDFSELYEINPV